MRVGGPQNRLAIALIALLVAPGAALAIEGNDLSLGFHGSVVAGAGRVLPTRELEPAGTTFGMGFGFDYEWSHARIASTFFVGPGGSWSSSALRLSVDWIPLAGTWSPYLGAGVGAAIIGKKRPYEPSGEAILPPYLDLLPMLSLEAGVELFRNQGRQLLLGVDLELPWNRPYDCNADFSSCGYVWQLRYPEVALYARLAF